MTECNICIEEYTKTTRKKIKCPSCDYEVCSVCTKQYVMDSTQEAHCMNCKVAFSNDFLNDNFSKKWNENEYRNHRTKLLFNEQKSHLPDTELYVSNLIQAEKLYEIADNIRSKMNSIHSTYDKQVLVYTDKIRELKEEIIKCEERVREINKERYKEIKPHSNEIRDLNASAYRIIHGGDKKEKKKREFLIHCCVNDCKGFVNNKYVCGLCETEMCPKCHKPKNEDHECNEDDVKTVEEIKKSCKNCPKCGIPTHKISGCPQMWCVECHVVWNWNTGEIDRSGVIHNPHYYQFLRNGNANNIRREQGDMLCGGNVDGLELRTSFLQSKLPYDERTSMLNTGYIVIEHINHISGHEMVKYQEAHPNTLRDLRVSYLRNTLTEDQWKSELKKYEKKERKKKDYREVLGLYVASVQDLLRNSVDLKDLQITQIIQMKNITNGVLEKLNKQYKIKGFVMKEIKLKESKWTKMKDITHV